MDLSKLESKVNIHLMKLHYTIMCDCDEESIDDCQVTDLCHIALGFV